MAANRASTIEEWENFFEELFRLMTDYEAFYELTDLRLRENILIRMESALLALQQVITLATERRLDCASVLQEIERRKKNVHSPINDFLSLQVLKWCFSSF